jgi:hypothetical protein
MYAVKEEGTDVVLGIFPDEVTADAAIRDGNFGDTDVYIDEA